MLCKFTKCSVYITENLKAVIFSSMMPLTGNVKQLARHIPATCFTSVMWFMSKIQMIWCVRHFFRFKSSKWRLHTQKETLWVALQVEVKIRSKFKGFLLGCIIKYVFVQVIQMLFSCKNVKGLFCGVEKELGTLKNLVWCQSIVSKF